MISCHEYERGFVFAVVNCLYKHPVLHTFVTRTHSTDGVSGNSNAQVKSNFRNEFSGEITQVRLLECDLATAPHDVTQHAHSPV